MCASWMYKNNSRGHAHQASIGDWHRFFDGDVPTHWGRVEWIPDLEQLQPGDQVLAYQTNRNELVGLAEVLEFRRLKGTRALWLRPIERIGVKVLPLKKSDARIAVIPALRQGPVRTIYDMTEADANRLLRAARAARDGAAGKTEVDESFEEGERRSTSAIVRNRALREAAKRAYGLRCYCCGFDFEEFYGPVAKGVAVVHHLEPFEARRGARTTSVYEVCIVCDNCHRVLHLTRPPMDVNELQDLLKQRSDVPKPRSRMQ